MNYETWRELLLDLPGHTKKNLHHEISIHDTKVIISLTSFFLFKPQNIVSQSRQDGSLQNPYIYI